MKAALVVGASGQDGAYLCRHLLAQGYDVYAGVRVNSQGHARLCEIAGRITFVELDVLDQISLDAALARYRPVEIYNLAAQSRVATSWQQPILTADVTALGTLRLCDSVKRLLPGARILQAGSSEMFGDATSSPQDEATEFHPKNPYGISKAFAHHTARAYRHQGLYVSNAIMYNHESPLRPEQFVTRKITAGAARIALGLQRELLLGNLETTRDWGFAGDFVEAMHAILAGGEPGDYVVGTGQGRTVREFCEAAFAAVDLDYREYVKTDPRFYRESEAHPLIANCEKIKRERGWRPKTSFDSMVHSMVHADLHLLEQSAAGSGVRKSMIAKGQGA